MVLLIRILYVFSPLSIYRRNAWVKKFAIPKNGEREAWKGDSERYSNRYEERVTLRSDRASNDIRTTSLHPRSLNRIPLFFLYPIRDRTASFSAMKSFHASFQFAWIVYHFLVAFFFFLFFFFHLEKSRLSRRSNLFGIRGNLSRNC